MLMTHAYRQHSTASVPRQQPVVYKRISQYCRNASQSQLDARADRLIAAKQRKLRANVFEFIKIYTLVSPLDYKLADIFKATTASKLKRKVFNAIASLQGKTKDAKLSKQLSKQLSKARDEILELKTRLCKLDTDKIDAILHRANAAAADNSRRAEAVLPAQLKQPTLVKHGIEDLVKTIISSNILPKHEQRQQHADAAAQL